MTAKSAPSQSTKSGIAEREVIGEAKRAGESVGEIALLFSTEFFEFWEREVELGFFPTVFSFIGGFGTDFNSPGYTPGVASAGTNVPFLNCREPPVPLVSFVAT